MRWKLFNRSTRIYQIPQNWKIFYMLYEYINTGNSSPHQKIKLSRLSPKQNKRKTKSTLSLYVVDLTTYIHVLAWMTHLFRCIIIDNHCCSCQSCDQQEDACKKYDHAQNTLLNNPFWLNKKILIKNKKYCTSVILG